MKRLKKLAKYSVFEQEIRDPGPTLKKVLENIISLKDNNEEDFWKHTEEINNAIEQDISMSKNDIIDYFECYSDFFKDVNNYRPHYDYVNQYLSTLCYAVADNSLTTNYSDYSRLESELERQDEDWDEQIDDATNAEQFDEDIADAYNGVDDSREEYDEFDRLPKRSPNRKKF